MKIYFAIGSNIKLNQPEVLAFTKSGVKRVLYSYAVVGGREDIPMPFEDVMLDSGAFSIATGNEIKVTLGGYSMWLQLYLSKYSQIKTYVNLDDLKDPAQSLKNLKKLEADGLHPIPVYHYGEPEEILDNYCKEYEYVGLGGFAVGRMPSEKMQTFWEYVASKYKDNKFHIFGVGTLKPFFNVQPYSLDSLSCIWNGAIRPAIAGYKNGLPDVMPIDRNQTGWDFFITREELLSMSARAMVDWEKCEWLKNIKGNNNGDSNQARMF